ncbi:MAG TPA: hypothetical protein VGM90_06255 [Kofleriaceae bacterium]
MLIEPVELTLAHVGLGELREVPLLALFASAQAHALVAGTEHTLRDVTDAAGAKLYPGYSWLHLRVPPSRRLGQFQVWDRVEVGVDVKRFGGMVLDSTYVLGAAGELSTMTADWPLDALPSMRAMSMWIVDGAPGDPQPSSPQRGAIAELPSLSNPPDAMKRFRTMRATGSFDREPRPWSTTKPVRYQLHMGRDVARDHNLMFATYVEIMEVATEAVLRGVVWPAIPAALLEHRMLLEREVFFLSHTKGGEQVLVDVRAKLTPCAENFHGDAKDMVSAGILDIVFELYEEGTSSLLAIAHARELFLVPRKRAGLVADLARFLPSS